MEDQEVSRRGKVRGRSNKAVLQTQPYIRPPVGRAIFRYQHSEIGSTLPAIALVDGSGNDGAGNSNGSSSKPIGREAICPSQYGGEMIITKPENLTCKQGTLVNKIELLANYFPLIKNVGCSIYKHHVEFLPEEDRNIARKALFGQHRKLFGCHLFDGSTLFSTCNFTPDGKKLELVSQNLEGKEFKITIRMVGIIEATDYQNLQICNIIVRECLASLGLQEIRRNYFDPLSKITIPEFKLELWPGFLTSVVQGEHNILLQAEIGWKVLRNDTAYDLLRLCIEEKTSASIKSNYEKAIIGCVIITLHNKRNYRVDEVDFNVTPNHTFPQKKDGVTKNIRYVDYFLERYNVRIQDVNQPMLVSRSNARQRRARQPELIYLPPELCVMTGLTDSMRSNFQLMKAVSNQTRVGPADRINRLNGFSKRLIERPAVQHKMKNWEIQIHPEMVKIPGLILPSEKIILANNKRFDTGKDANWDRHLRNNEILQPVNINNWVIIYLKDEMKDVLIFCKQLNTAARGMVNVISEPAPYQLQDERISSYLSAIDRALNERNPQLVMMVVPNIRSDRYSAIKKKCILDRPIPSQIIQMKNIKSKNAMSIATKVAIQMNCKVGGAPWTVEIPLREGVMSVGFDVCHDPRDKRRSYGAMVAALNTACAHWFSTVSPHSTGDEISKNFHLNICKCLHAYRENNGGQLPGYIIIYRDGVGQGQLKYVMELEVKKVQELLEEEYRKVEKKLKMSFIIVTKKHHTRLFHCTQNPPPGTVVDKVITNPSRYDFYLVSQSVQQRTVTPTHYNVIADTTGFPVERMQRLTYKLTYLYYNWSGTVRVPAPCQYAHKLAFLTSQSIGATHSNLNRFLYFL